MPDTGLFFSTFSPQDLPQFQDISLSSPFYDEKMEVQRN